MPGSEPVLFSQNEIRLVRDNEMLSCISPCLLDVPKVGRQITGKKTTPQKRLPLPCAQCTQTVFVIRFFLTCHVRVVRFYQSCSPPPPPPPPPRSQWALPDLNRQVPVGTAGPQPRLPDRSGHAGPQPRLPDRSGHCQTSTGRMSEKMSERMSEDMPDRMPERMSERMSEDMPDRM